MTPENEVALAAAVSRLAAALECPQVEGLDANGSAAFSGVSISKWRDMDTRGLCPMLVLIGDGKCKRWIRTELAAWLAAGAPSRAEWVRRREGEMRRYRRAAG